MKPLKIKPAHLAFLLIMVLGTVIIFGVTKEMEKEERLNRSMRLASVNQDAVDKFKHSVSKFALLVSGYRAYIIKSDTIPSIQNSQDFVNEILDKVNYQEQIIVSFIDTGHVFQYTFTPDSIDPSNLKGLCVKDFRDQQEIRNLDLLMTNDSLKLFEPLNLKEGWLGIPLNFRVHKNNKTLGYIAPIINFKTIIQPIYNIPEIKNDFAFEFSVTKNKNRFDRESVLDGTTIYNTNQDPESSVLFQTKDSTDYEFVQQSFTLYGQEFQIRTFYKEPFSTNKFLSYVLYIWFAALICFSFIFYRKTKNRERISKLLGEALEDLSYRNDKVTQSINYARRIQDSILIPPSTILSEFKDGFILNMPKDIVSGDFYWYTKHGPKKILALADCTGHGVPGAFMTVLGVSFLNEIINEQGELNPREILKQLQRKMVESIRNKDIKSYDGMDISIVCIDEEHKTITLCSLGSSVYLIKQGIVHEERGLGIGIGPFNENLLNLLENKEFKLADVQQILLSSDGFHDQFGGSSQHKYMKKQMRGFFEKIASEDLENQQIRLREELQRWKGELEQTDDILVIGIKP